MHESNHPITRYDTRSALLWPFAKSASGSSAAGRRLSQLHDGRRNSGLKEHKRVEEQQATIEQLKKERETVVARLKERDSKIETVKAQIEVKMVMPRVVANEP
jgi:hypothetical protein